MVLSYEPHLPRLVMEVSSQVNSKGIPISVIQLPAGRLNAANSQQVSQDLTEQLKDLQLFQMLGESPSTIVLDLSLLSFVDSIGIGVLITFAKRCAKIGWTLKLSGLRPQAKAAFEILELGKLFQFYNSVEDAIESVATADSH